MSERPDHGSAWFSTAETASQLGVTPRTVYSFANSGDLVGYRMGRVFRFRSADITRFLDTRRIQPGDLDHLLMDERADPTPGS